MIEGRIAIPVGLMEFDVGGHTIWVHSNQGATVLRIKCTGKITVDEVCQNSVPHADLMVQGDIEICIPEPRIE